MPQRSLNQTLSCLFTLVLAYLNRSPAAERHGSYQGTRSFCVSTLSTLRDYGLMARMARTISPDPHAASMLLKASANSLCQGDDEQGRQTCEMIADFVDAPGSLTLKRRADVPPASMVELALNVLSARLGYLFEAEVTQGGASLTTQTEKIYGLGR